MPGGTFNSADMDHVIDALHSIKFIREHYASGPKGAELIKEITGALREAGINTKTRAFVVFADAINKALSSGPIEDS